MIRGDVYRLVQISRLCLGQLPFLLMVLVCLHGQSNSWGRGARRPEGQRTVGLNRRRGMVMILMAGIPRSLSASQLTSIIMPIDPEPRLHQW